MPSLATFLKSVPDVLKIFQLAGTEQVITLFPKLSSLLPFLESIEGLALKFSKKASSELKLQFQSILSSHKKYQLIYLANKQYSLENFLHAKEYLYLLFCVNPYTPLSNFREFLPKIINNPIYLQIICNLNTALIFRVYVILLSSGQSSIICKYFAHVIIDAFFLQIDNLFPFSTVITPISFYSTIASRVYSFWYTQNRKSLLSNSSLLNQASSSSKTILSKPSNLSELSDKFFSDIVHEIQSACTVSIQILESSGSDQLGTFPSLKILKSNVNRKDDILRTIFQSIHSKSSQG